ncbi:MAG: polysaccharide deacetylase family protein [bacterium]|nr:polysaccharide deacetylase family protein [bacterium]
MLQKTASESITREKPYLAFTFDDGWLDNFENAFPLLMEEQTPATIFLPTAYIENKSEQEQLLFWTDKISMIASELSNEYINRYPPDYLPLDVQKAVRHFLSICKNTDAVSENINYFLAPFRPLIRPEREIAIQWLENEFHEQMLSHHRQRHISWEHAKTMAKSGIISFGIHSHQHNLQTELNPEEIQADYKKAVATFTEQQVPFIDAYCYPGGSYNDTTQMTLANAGVKNTIITTPNSYKETQPQIWGRVGIHEDISNSTAKLAFRLWRQ